ncbi:MAG: hypothetical protein ACK443_09105 [Methylococcaceae bacterium]|jgi:hypothetical protein
MDADKAANSGMTDMQTQGNSARFQFFLIDSGWNTTCTRIVRENLSMITEFQNDDPLYVLNREQSVALLKRHPHLIGKDPILMARDMNVRGAGRPDDYHGFHLNMGVLWESEKTAEVLRQFLNFLTTHRDSANIDRDIRKKLHRDGLNGAIEVLRSGSEVMVG